eukprot:CAMPEP_0183713758 /NCGR_PEP_ID=MMETSP0737-20130205/8509_1 /TAXON_ID=385413 /ORGANISM="Thalassiosira miniscula, Strain CCMP1093" /LENGTH=633 /DNA_ID=CAMNT_0025942587 /DNA_START=42 /DNA_END=1943 /DNA_ORIENTATION=-
MPRRFSRRGYGDDDGNFDDMTMTSGRSRGSVSDRIMGRMKMNLHFSSGGSRSNNVGSSSSVPGNSRRSVSAGRFGRGARSTFSVDGGSRGSRGGISNPLRSQSSPRHRFSGGHSARGPSSLGVPSMEEMDSNEAMALKGQSFGRRRRDMHTLKRSLSIGKQNDPPAEHSLGELRAMSEAELGGAMSRAGVPAEDISRTLNGAVKSDHLDQSNVEEERKKSLVTLFVNSGRVKLVPDKPIVMPKEIPLVPKLGDNRTTVSSLDSDSMGEDRSDPKDPDEEQPEKRASVQNNSAGDLNPDLPKSIETSSPIKEVQIISSKKHNEKEKEKEKEQSRKSKLEKIAELKTENNKVKRENKSLKKTVKKLLGQLSNSNMEKVELQQTLDRVEKLREKEERSKQKEISNDGLGQSSNHSTLHSIDEINKSQDEEIDNVRLTTPSQRPDYDVIAHADVSPGSTTSGTMSKRDSVSGRSVGSEKSLTSKINYLKQKYKKEKDAHTSTEFRLQAEIGILTKEVDGLQRELAMSLESLDDHKKRSRKDRESNTDLKHELRNATAKVKELTAEAEARDKLIGTFSKILLEKVGLNGIDGGDGDLDISRLSAVENGQVVRGEEKLGDGDNGVVMMQSWGELKPPKF